AELFPCQLERPSLFPRAAPAGSFRSPWPGGSWEPRPPISARSTRCPWQPALFYLVASVFRFVPPTAWSLRLPTTILAIVNVILIYLVARKLFSNGWYAVVAAGVLSLTPAHYFFARRALDYFCQLPIALAWLWCLSLYGESAPAWLPAAIGLLLGL